MTDEPLHYLEGCKTTVSYIADKNKKIRLIGQYMGVYSIGEYNPPFLIFKIKKMYRLIPFDRIIDVDFFGKPKTVKEKKENSNIYG